MDGARIDRLARALAAGAPRRALLAHLAGGVLGAALARGGGAAAAACQLDGQPCEGATACCPGLACWRPTPFDPGHCRPAAGGRGGRHDHPDRGPWKPGRGGW